MTHITRICFEYFKDKISEYQEISKYFEKKSRFENKLIESRGLSCESGNLIITDFTSPEK